MRSERAQATLGNADVGATTTPPHVWRLRWEVWAWRHGWAWPATGVLCLIAMALFALSWTDRRSAAQADLASAAKNDGLARQTRAASAKPVVEPGQARLDAMLREAPGQVQGASLLLELAKQQGVAVAQGQYTLVPASEIGVEETQIQFRFRAGYPQTRRFLEAALARLPTLSVERVSISRESATQASPEVLISMTLHRVQARSAGSGGQT